MNSETEITQDFTTDPNGRILSMTYDEEDAEEGVNGEYYYHFDNFGNTAMLTDASGNRQYAALYDLNNGKMVEEWNPNGLDFVIKGNGIESSISFHLPSDGPTIEITDEQMAKILETAMYLYLNAQNARNMAEATKTRTDDESPCSNPCSQCDPSKRSGNISSRLSHEWLDAAQCDFNELRTANCDKIIGKKDTLMGSMKSRGRLGYDKDYTHYNPWDDDGWVNSILELFDPDAKGAAQTYFEAINDDKFRYTVASLQTMDCLLACKGCKDRERK